MTREEWWLENGGIIRRGRTDDSRQNEHGHEETTDEGDVRGRRRVGVAYSHIRPVTVSLIQQAWAIDGG